MATDGDEKSGISPELSRQIDHMAGVGCVVRYQYGTEVETCLLEEESLESELWQEVAFTNGPPLVRIIIEYAPEEAKKLAETAAADKPTAAA